MVVTIKAEGWSKVNGFGECGVLPHWLGPSDRPLGTQQGPAALS